MRRSNAVKWKARFGQQRNAIPVTPTQARKADESIRRGNANGYEISDATSSHRTIFAVGSSGKSKSPRRLMAQKTNQTFRIAMRVPVRIDSPRLYLTKVPEPICTVTPFGLSRCRGGRDGV
jgi:hypothetical protein